MVVKWDQSLSNTVWLIVAFFSFHKNTSFYKANRVFQMRGILLNLRNHHIIRQTIPCFSKIKFLNELLLYWELLIAVCRSSLL